jgi:hypothetical protein
MADQPRKEGNRRLKSLLFISPSLILYSEVPIEIDMYTISTCRKTKELWLPTLSCFVVGVEDIKNRYNTSLG